MKIKCYILLSDEYVHVPEAAIILDKEEGVSHMSCKTETLDNILSERLLDLDDDGLTIINKPLSDSMTDEEWEEWDDSNPVGELIGGDGEYYYWDTRNGKISVFVNGTIYDYD